MAINMAAHQESARKHFVKKAREDIGNMMMCWPQTLGAYLRSLNKLVEAGRKWGSKVTEADVFSPEEIDGIVRDLSPFLELEMHDEVKSYFLPILVQKKFDEEVLLPLLVQKESGEEPGEPKKAKEVAEA